jgi:hypothetical protein
LGHVCTYAKLCRPDFVTRTDGAAYRPASRIGSTCTKLCRAEVKNERDLKDETAGPRKGQPFQTSNRFFGLTEKRMATGVAGFIA